MFNIIESINKSPIRLPIKPGISLYPGNIVSIIEYEGNTVVDLCTGNNPLGLVSNRCFGGNKINLYHKASIHMQRMVLNLNRFDRKNNIEIGNSLYCNAQGLLSSKKPFEDAFVLCKVITPASKENNYMQILWL